MNCGKGLFSMKFKGLNYTYFGSLNKSDKKMSNCSSSHKHKGPSFEKPKPISFLKLFAFNPKNYVFAICKYKTTNRLISEHFAFK